MTEASLITKCDGYEQVWLEFLPMLWQCTVTNCKDDLTAQGLNDKDLESMEDGRLKILFNPHLKVHVHVYLVATWPKMKLHARGIDYLVVSGSLNRGVKL